MQNLIIAAGSSGGDNIKDLIHRSPANQELYCDTAHVFCTFDPAVWLGVKRSLVQVQSPRFS